MFGLPQTVLITGASSGIGKETAFRFAASGYRVVLTYFRNRAGALEVAEECLRLGAADVLAAPLNVMDDASIDEAVASVGAKYSSLAILINNAGVSVRKPLLEQSSADIEAQLRTNLEGLVKVTKAFLPRVTDAVINVASGAGQRGWPDLTTYCASKFGVRGFTQALALEVPRLRVLSVNPDATSTRTHRFARGRPPEQVAAVILEVAEARLGLRSGDDVNVWEFA